jgi:hypothetical protein
MAVSETANTECSTAFAHDAADNFRCHENLFVGFYGKTERRARLGGFLFTLAEE